MSIGALFTGLSINMIFASQRKGEEDDIILHSEDYPWIKHLNALWEIRFE